MTSNKRRVKDSNTVMLTRIAVRNALGKAGILNSNKFVLVGLSGGADSLSLAAATAWVADRNSFTAGAVIVNHNLQEGSRRIAEEAAEKARNLGLSPVIIKDVSVPESSGAGGPENAARIARYEAFEEVLNLTGASKILTAHTNNDNAEQVLISLVRGSGVRSLAGIREERDYILRPFLTSVSRADTVKACDDLNLEHWQDPQNKDTTYTRVRVRENVLPVLQTELGDGIIDSLNRTAELASEDADAFDWMVERVLKDIPVDVENGTVEISVSSLEDLPEGILNRVFRSIILQHFGESISREQTVNISKLVNGWHGQKHVDAVGVIAKRSNGNITLTSNKSQ